MVKDLNHLVKEFYDEKHDISEELNKELDQVGNK